MPADDVKCPLSHADLCKMSLAFNEYKTWDTDQRWRINEWLKQAIASASGTGMPPEIPNMSVDDAAQIFYHNAPWPEGQTMQGWRHTACMFHAAGRTLVNHFMSASARDVKGADDVPD